MVAECAYRRIDSLLVYSYCRAASNDSLTGILTFAPNHVTCGGCPVPGLRRIHTCAHLELRPVIVPSRQGSRVVDLERFCQEDGIKLDSLIGCDAACAAYRPAPHGYRAYSWLLRAHALGGATSGPVRCSAPGVRRTAGGSTPRILRS